MMSCTIVHILTLAFSWLRGVVASVVSTDVWLVFKELIVPFQFHVSPLVTFNIITGTSRLKCNVKSLTYHPHNTRDSPSMITEAARACVPRPDVPRPASRGIVSPCRTVPRCRQPHCSDATPCLLLFCCLRTCRKRQPILNFSYQTLT